MQVEETPAGSIKFILKFPFEYICFAQLYNYQDDQVPAIAFLF